MSDVTMHCNTYYTEFICVVTQMEIEYFMTPHTISTYIFGLRTFPTSVCLGLNIL